MLLAVLVVIVPGVLSLDGCENGTKPCIYAPGKTACCTPGEACVPNVGCRCEGSDCSLNWKSERLAEFSDAPTPACKNGTKPCVYAPGKTACCTPGESCVPNVGCRCEEGDCSQFNWPSRQLAPTGGPTPACRNGTKPCLYAPHKFACCTPGEACVPNVGCRCEEGDCEQFDWQSEQIEAAQAQPTPGCSNGTKPCDYAPGKMQCCTPGEACVQGVGCRCDGEDCETHQAADPGIFGNPRDICRYGTLLEGEPLNNTRTQFIAVTWNLQGWTQQPGNIQKQAQVLLSYNADFIATQEDRYGWDTQKAMGEGNYCFMGETRDGRSCSPSCPVKVPLTTNGGDGEHTFIYYNCKKWQVLETSTVFMGWFPDGYPRIYTNGRFQNLETKQQIWLTSTHFPKKTEIEGQKQCIQFLLTMGDEWRGNSLLMGDFNINEASAPSTLYKPLKSSRFVFDTYDACPQCRLSHNGYDKHFATIIGSNVWADETHTDLSDHNPIIASYEI